MSEPIEILEAVAEQAKPKEPDPAPEPAGRLDEDEAPWMTVKERPLDRKPCAPETWRVPPARRTTSRQRRPFSGRWAGRPPDERPDEAEQNRVDGSEHESEWDEPKHDCRVEDLAENCPCARPSRPPIPKGRDACDQEREDPHSGA